MDDIFLGLGSNIGDKGKNIQNALILLEKWGLKILQSSSLYETEPVGYTDQDWFINMVVRGQTEMQPEELLMAIHAIERMLKRERIVRWGPRTIDIDILLFGEQVVDKKGLTIPHPRLHERLFVLKPLAEISPDAFHPLLQKRAIDLLNECSDTSIVNIQN